MRMKLDKKYEYVETSRITEGSLTYVTRKKVEYNRFVDISKLEHHRKLFRIKSIFFQLIFY